MVAAAASSCMLVGRRTFRENEARPNEELPAGDYVELTVIDDGPGMTPEVRERILEPFFTTKPQGKGTGLGLSVVHGIIHGHEGAMTVDSAPGKGAPFRMFLPVAAAGSDLEKKASNIAKIERGRGQKLLVVDDEPLVRSTVCQILEHLGYEVTVKEDPMATLGELESSSKHFDLILTDLSMPGMNGTESARSAWAIRSEIPIILMTGHLRELEPREYCEMGFREVLQKPITVPMLSQAVAAVFPSAAG